MTRPAADSVKVEWTGTGTGTMSLGSNVSGFASFPASADGLPVSYEIAHQTATERENGLGTYTAAGNTLSRDFVTFSTAGAPTKVTFSTGAKHVRLTALASDFVENRATTDPTSSDGLAAGYVAGRSRWLNTSAGRLWFCIDDSPGSPGAVWVQVGAGGGGAVLSVNGETGAVVLDATDIAAVHSPSNYTPVGSPSDDIESHLAGIDAEFGALSVGSDAAPTQVTSNAAEYVLTTASRLHNNVEVLSHQASVDFEVSTDATASSRWLIMPGHDGCTVSVDTNAGSVNGVNGGSARLVNGGIVIVRVASNAGSAPSVQVRGDIIMPAIDVGGTKTYDNDDAHQDFRLTSTSTQTFGAAANYAAGFYVNLFKETSGDVTIDGVDADYTMHPIASPAAPAVVTVMKVGTALIAFGSDGASVLDAA